MKRIRVIPVLLIKDEGLVKGVQFEKHRYVGDPINAVKIFNEKEVDEIAIIDISSSRHKTGPNFELIQDITNEAFMPLAYGGGISNLDQIKKLISSGVEKVIINTSLFNSKKFIKESIKIFGSQSIIASIDVKTNWRGKYQVMTNNGADKVSKDLVEVIKEVEDMGCGEIIIQSIDNEGGAGGYDLQLIDLVSKNTNLPVVALGGAWGTLDFVDAVQAGALAVAAGSKFVFHGKHKAVLITYPNQEEIITNFYSKL